MLAHDGRPAAAVEYMLQAIRHDPYPPPIYLTYLGNAYYLTQQYDAAFATLRDAVEAMPDYKAASVWLAAAAAQSMHLQEAKTTVAIVLHEDPEFTIHDWLRHIGFERQIDGDRLAEGLRNAGFPE